MTGFQATMIDNSPTASMPASRLRAFTRARRHSRWVRFAKWAIPLGSLIGIALVLLVVIFDPFRVLRGLTLGPVSISGTQITMESPKLSGFRNDSRPYQVTATAATQDVRNPNLVELKDLRAHLATDDQGGTAHMEAATGILDTQKEQMRLKKDIVVRTESGQEAKLLSAFVDFKRGLVISKEPVTVSLSNGVIDAEGLKVSDNGKVIRFDGRVRTVFRNTSQAGSPSSSAPTTPSPAQPTSSRP